MKVKMQTHLETKEIKNIILIVCFVMLAFTNGCGTDKLENPNEISSTNEQADKYNLF